MKDLIILIITLLVLVPIARSMYLQSLRSIEDEVKHDNVEPEFSELYFVNEEGLQELIKDF